MKCVTLKESQSDRSSPIWRSSWALLRLSGASVDIYRQQGFQQHTSHTLHTAPASFPLNGDILWNHIQSLWSRHTSSSIAQLLDSPEQGWQNGPRDHQLSGWQYERRKKPELASFFHKLEADIDNIHMYIYNIFIIYIKTIIKILYNNINLNNLI